MPQAKTHMRSDGHARTAVVGKREVKESNNNKRRVGGEIVLNSNEVKKTKKKRREVVVEEEEVNEEDEIRQRKPSKSIEKRREEDEEEEVVKSSSAKKRKVETKTQPRTAVVAHDDDDDDNDIQPQRKHTMLDSDSDDEHDDFRLTHLGEKLDEEDSEQDADSQQLIPLPNDDDDDDNDNNNDDQDEDDMVPTTLLENMEAPSDIAARIKDTVAQLANFSETRRRQATTTSTTSRKQLMSMLENDCAIYYGYLPDLIDIFSSLFGPTELIDFLEANEVPRPTVIRTNTIKTTRRSLAQALTSRGVGLEPVASWSDVGLKIFDSNSVPIGATPEYLAGHYMLQSASSFVPVMALGPLPGERVLDMCASPGGKTTYIAQLMKNQGFIVANDAKKQRIPALVANLARLGVHNTAVVNYDGKEFPKVLGGFDRVLLDAPCSGLGVISHDASVKQSRSLKDINSSAQLQKELLLSAIDSCDHKSPHGGIIVYSTCSISVQENEQVVQYALRNRNIKIVDCELQFGSSGLVKWMGHVFHPSMKLAKRLYPHRENMDGFFICKLKKLGAGKVEPAATVVRTDAKRGA